MSTTPSLGNLPINLPVLLESRALIQANSGAGKSWTLRRILEQTASGVQQLVIDPEGEFASLREKFDYIVCAPHDADAVATPQTAALAAPPAAQKRGEARVAFPAGSTDLPPNARGDLDQMARRLAGDEALRVQLNAYAAENGDQASQARRISLSRALAVRAYLIDKGVRSTRLDVRALGKPQDNGPADRVDLVVVGR